MSTLLLRVDVVLLVAALVLVLRLWRRQADGPATVQRRLEKSVLDSLSEGVFGLDADRRITFANRAALGMLGLDEHAVLGQHEHSLLHPQRTDGSDYPPEDCPMAWLDSDTGVYGMEEHFRRHDGSIIDVQISTTLLPEVNGATRALLMFRDLGERKQNQAALLSAFRDLDVLNRRLEAAYAKLLRSEKLATVGQLAAGMAHEINNPIGFVSSNLSSLAHYTAALLDLLASYEKLEAGLPEESRAQLARQRDEMDYKYLHSDVQALLAESREGVDRVRKIVQDLKEFSREGAEAQWTTANLHQCIDLSVNMLARELEGRCQIVREYGDIPDVYCLPSEINQVIMGILLNAAQSISGNGTIGIRTEQAGDQVCIEVSDTGCGMTEEVLSRIFDPFFTTKPVGKGSGLGLSMAYGAIQRHGGDIAVTSELDKGSVVRLRLPIDSRDATPAVPLSTKGSEVSAV